MPKLNPHALTVAERAARDRAIRELHRQDPSLNYAGIARALKTSREVVRRALKIEKPVEEKEKPNPEEIALLMDRWNFEDAETSDGGSRAW